MFLGKRKKNFSQRHRGTEGAVVLALVLCLGLLFVGCPDDKFVDDGKLNSKLIGTWLDVNPEYGTDGYTVTATKVTYISDWFPSAGTIKHVTNFSDSAGVIIIEYDEEYENPAGNFIGIYFKELKSGVSVQMGTASLYPDDAEEETLEAAKAAFTLGNEGTYMSYYGTYLWTTETE